MNAGDDDSDDGLVLAGDANPGMPPFNPIAMSDPNMDLNFQKLG